MFIPYVINSPAAIIKFWGHFSKLSVLRTPHLIPADILKAKQDVLHLSPDLPITGSARG